ncbi:MAG: hypothetical protein DHS20C18_33590 [Saprospiraceae bacterium]|nr:MAG: hypothetical protein DHS20C18_33590 [Saprospiraceae bacterium]
MKKVMITLLIAATFLTGSAQDIGKVDLKKMDIKDKVDKLVKAYIDLDIFSGVVLIAQDGDPYYHQAFGLANREKNIPNTLTTKFDIGSMNKAFTKVVILQLVEAGKLKLSDKLGEYLEGFPENVATQVTIDQLLNHTSGFGDYHTPGFFEAPRSEKTIEAITKHARTMPLMFAPGSDNSYSNTGYILLGAVIEKITGKSYHENVKKRIIQPLNLKDTYVENKDQVPNRSIGYFKDIKGHIQDNEGFLEIPNPDGGFQSTTTDILTFYREFHYGNQLLKEKTKQLDESWQFMETHRNTGGAIPHAGGFNGANTVLYEVLRDKISVLVFANMDEPVAEQLGVGILAIIRGKVPNQPSLPASQNVYQALQEHGTNYVKENFEALTTNFHPSDPRDFILNAIGYDLLSSGETDEAIQIFEFNTELFPEVANVWDSLGEAWLKKGDKKKALKYYKKALSIQPGLPSAKEAVARLE